MSAYVSSVVRRAVCNRAGGCCEYCLIHADDCLLPHEPDHIIATKHRGESGEDNLAWTCFVCNRAKGSDIASVDPESGEVVRLFSPRRDQWADHFALGTDGRISPLTDVGRVTVSLLRMNRGQQVELRLTLMKAGLYPRFDQMHSTPVDEP